MKVHVYPADLAGCGYHRMIWPAEYLAAQGHDVTVVRPVENSVLRIDPCDVFVMQRPTHRNMLTLIQQLLTRGTTVVVDIDDDLSAIHPANPAFLAMHPKSVGVRYTDGRTNMHAWTHLAEACQIASLVTVSTPALLSRYAMHGRGVVLDNYLSDHYYGVPHEDSDLIGWPASLHSHPDDPSAVGSAIARLVGQGARFEALSSPGAGRAFGLAFDPAGLGGNLELSDWPAAVARFGIGIAPLADTRFNAAKSRLKVLEMAATGVPFVASPRAEYEAFHQQEGAGLLADRPKEWYRSLKALLADERMRSELAGAGRAAADRNRLRDHAWRWLEAWETAHKVNRRRFSPLGARRPF